MGDWDALCYTQIEGEFDERYAAFREKYGYLPLLIQYIHEEKYLKRKQFTKPWTSQVRYFGYTVTSRSESGHS